MKLKKSDIKIGSKEEALWKAVRESREERIKQLENDLIVEREVLILAIRKQTEEHNAFIRSS